MIDMKTVIIDAGNEIYGDDGIAAAIIKDLKKLPLSQDITILSVGTDPFFILGQDLDRCDLIIVVDGIRCGGQAGEIYFIPAEDIKPEPRPYSIHDITWYEVLKMGGLLNKTRLFAVKIDTLNMKEELSPTLQEKVGYYAEKLYEILGYT